MDSHHVSSKETQMSFPYVSDLINHFFGTHWQVPIATFGSFVAIAVLVATVVAKKEIVRFEILGKLPQATITPTIKVPVHSLLSNLTIVCTLFGIIGARLFHILEYPTEFLANPFDMIFSRAGLSIYGGLIFGTIAGIVFLKKRTIPILITLDAVAPAMMLAYGIGRIGCQISGDGDWGKPANMALKPSWVPDFFWAQTYDNNIVGVVLQSPGVYPTPMYESLMAFCLFAVLWAIRKNHHLTGYMFSIYLLFSGFARLLIEKIRINSEYHFLGANFTQAEFISVILILAGLFGILRSSQTNRAPKIAFTALILSGLTACSMFH